MLGGVRLARAAARRNLGGLSGAALVLLAQAAAPVSAPAQEWPAEAYDPAPDPDGQELVLPMPCGGAMIVRKVETTSLRDDDGEPAWLNDRKIQLGYAGAEFNAVEYLQQRYVQGAFADPETNGRFFYLGKYEVTVGQYRAVMAETCPDAGALEAMLPVTDLSWFDAVDFTRRYSEWLYAEAAGALPRTAGEQAAGDGGGPQSFVRLPTEEEWEYAARGGWRVTDQEFRAPIYPLAEGETLADHAWYNAPESSRGELNVIGWLGRNPLGLHDVLGNAEEFVLEPFRLNRANRRHGQAGGFVTKGGSFRTPAEDIRTSRRDEYGYFDPTTGLARRLDSFGFRIALSAPVQTDFERIQEIERSWSEVTARAALDPTLSDPLVVLQELADRTEEQETVDVIEVAVGQLVQERGERADLEQQTLRALMLSGAMAGRIVLGLRDRVASARSALEFACKDCSERQSERACNFCNNVYPEVLAKAEAELDTSQNLYMTNLLTVSDEFPEERWGTALPDLREEMAASETQRLFPFAEVFVRHVKGHQSGGAIDLRQIGEDLDALELQ